MKIDPYTLQDRVPEVEVIESFLIFLLVFGMSATVDLGEIEEQLKNKKAIAMGKL